MKIMILALATAGFAASAIAASPAPQQGGWPASIDKPATAAQSAPVAAPTGTTAADLARLGDVPPAAATAEKWSDLDDTHRYLLIMGTVDGFGAAGKGAPCFPGNDNTGLDAKLRTAGFSDSDPATLAEAMEKIGTPKERCTAQQSRGYPNKLLKGMPDDHLATYLTGVVRAYSRVQPCEPKNQAYAGAAAAAAVFIGQDDAQPVSVLAPALVEGCKGPK